MNTPPRVQARAQGAWVLFVEVEQLRSGRRMRSNEEDTEVLTVANIRLLGKSGNPNILFTNGSGLNIESAKRNGWQIEL